MLVTTTYCEMILVALSLGVAKGLRNVYMSIVIPSYIPLDRLASASGIQMFANGLAMMFLGPVLGKNDNRDEFKKLFNQIVSELLQV